MDEKQKEEEILNEYGEVSEHILEILKKNGEQTDKE